MHPAFTSLVVLLQSCILLASPSDREQMDVASKTGSCAFQCASTMNTEMGKIASPYAGQIHSQLLKPEQLTEFCRVYSIGAKCADNCTDSPVKSALMSALQIPHYICVKRKEEFISFIPCFSKAQENLHDSCMPICGGVNQMRQLKEELRSSVANHESMTKISHVMGKACTALSCEIVCQEPVIMRICEQREAALFMRDLIRQGLVPMQDLLVELQADEHWPSACRDLVGEVSTISPTLQSTMSLEDTMSTLRTGTRITTMLTSLLGNVFTPPTPFSEEEFKEASNRILPLNDEAAAKASSVASLNPVMYAIVFFQLLSIVYRTQ